ncbi:MAG TPA: PEP/pyruvate-binding domain-containing protein [Rhodocyclaceae bacterium]|nr:PEP/pyruvate-binding domain-containing protein [Rhodocyclaceae bacterium]
MSNLARMSCALLLLLALAPMQAWGQLAEKPSTFTAQRRGSAMTTSGTGSAARTKAAFLDSITSRAEFDGLARVYDPGTPQAIVHTIFVIDRAHGDRVYFINAQRFKLHEDFLRAQFLVANLDHKTIASYYDKPDRRFVFGTIGFHPELQQWLYEFWEGDRMTTELLTLTQRRLATTFFAPATFKTNSTQHEDVAHEAGLPMMTEAQIIGSRNFLPLNPGVAQGRLRLVVDIEAEGEDDIEATDIVVLQHVALAIPPVAGVITEKPSTMLSHVNLLVKGWGVPNAYVKNAFDALKPFEGQWVKLTVGNSGYTIVPAPRPQHLVDRPKVTRVRAPDLQQRGLKPLAQLRTASSDACGGKAAILGEIEEARRARKLTGVAPVPDGFCIPYAQYVAFMKQPEIRQRIQAALTVAGFEQSRAVRRKSLEDLRRDLIEMPADAATEASWTRQWQAQLGSAGAFVRSSSNSEDLTHFSGAGLYTTVPNVTRGADIPQAVKTVWASVFNFEAFEARRHAGIALEQVAMAVFVQRAVDSVTSGVMITRDPFDVTHQNAVYISAKRGIGIKVVEGRRVAEQSMLDVWSGAVRRLARSDEDSELKLDATGGVIEKPIDAANAVLSEDQVRALAFAGHQIKRLRAGVEQDIEWAINPQGRIVILQSRPYIERRVL